MLSADPQEESFDCFSIGFLIKHNVSEVQHCIVQEILKLPFEKLNATRL